MAGNITKLPAQSGAFEAVGDRPAFFAMGFAPTLKLVSVVRRFVESFYEQILGDRELGGRVALTTHELLENAVRYCNEGETTIRVSVGRFANDYQITIRTRNRAEQINIQRATELLDRIKKASDPDDFYQELLIEAASRDEGSGLGLARIQAEGRMQLDYDASEETLEVVASCRYRLVEQGAA